MKVKRRLPDSWKRKTKGGHTGDSVRSFMLITVCAFTAVVLAVGSKVLDNSENGRVYAAETRFEDGGASLPTGIAGVVTGVRDTAFSEKSVERIGTSCEQVVVGQRIKTVEDGVTEFDVSSSMASSVNAFDRKAIELVSSPTIMSDTDYDTLLRIVEAEAGTEDVKGRVLVANVIMNRVEHEEFPDSITDVVWDYSNGVPQFSPTYDGRIGTVTVSDDTREAVKQAMEGVDYSEGALFFMQKSAAEDHNVNWFEKDLKKLFKYGVHEFYTYPDETDRKEDKQNMEGDVVQMVKNDVG